MEWLVILGLLLGGCSKGVEPNDPYVIEETEFEYKAPAPYYDEKDQGS